MKCLGQWITKKMIQKALAAHFTGLVEKCKNQFPTLLGRFTKAPEESHERLCLSCVRVFPHRSVFVSTAVRAARTCVGEKEGESKEWRRMELCSDRRMGNTAVDVLTSISVSVCRRAGTPTADVNMVNTHTHTHLVDGDTFRFKWLLTELFTHPFLLHSLLNWSKLIYNETPSQQSPTLELWAVQMNKD